MNAGHAGLDGAGVVPVRGDQVIDRGHDEVHSLGEIGGRGLEGAAPLSAPLLQPVAATPTASVEAGTRWPTPAETACAALRLLS